MYVYESMMCCSDDQPFDCTTFVWKSLLCMVMSLGPEFSKKLLELLMLHI